MATHKKYPIFIRVKTTDNNIVCVNPQHIASFQIVEKTTVRLKDRAEPLETSVLKFYFPQGTELSYVVGVDITRDEFDYVIATLIEYLYLNEHEFKARSQALAEQRLKEWNDTMASPEVDAVEPTTPESIAA